jgi:hypothetical protein
LAYHRAWISEAERHPINKEIAMNFSTRFSLLLVNCLLVCSAASADQATCNLIEAASVKTDHTHMQMKVTGYDYANDTPMLYGSGTHTCNYLRDETIDAQPSAVYREQFRSKIGATDATIWISKTSGQTLRVEQDGDIAGKGKGHISYGSSAAKP